MELTKVVSRESHGLYRFKTQIKLNYKDMKLHVALCLRVFVAKTKDNQLPNLFVAQNQNLISLPDNC